MTDLHLKVYDNVINERFTNELIYMPPEYKVRIYEK